VGGQSAEEELMTYLDEQKVAKPKGRLPLKHEPPYYECHVTVESGPFLTNDEIAMRAVLKPTVWSFSRIADDIVLGAGIKFYATAHFDLKVKRISRREVMAQMDGIIAALQRASLKVVRKKIECVVEDQLVED
jgi:hypothetical protein